MVGQLLLGQQYSYPGISQTILQCGRRFEEDKGQHFSYGYMQDPLVERISVTGLKLYGKPNDR